MKKNKNCPYDDWACRVYNHCDNCPQGATASKTTKKTSKAKHSHEIMKKKALQEKARKAKKLWLSVANKYNLSPEYRMACHTDWVNAEAELKRLYPESHKDKTMKKPLPKINEIKSIDALYVHSDGQYTMWHKGSGGAIVSAKTLKECKVKFKEAMNLALAVAKLISFSMSGNFGKSPTS